MFKNQYLGFIFLVVIFFIGCEPGLEKDISSIEPSVYLSAEELISGLQGDQDFYKEEVVLVTGYLVETNTKNNKFNILIKSGTNQNHYIICEMSSSFQEPINGFLKNEPISLKGILKGYLNDAVLLNCVLDNRLENE